MMNGALGRFFRYKVFVDALFHSEVMSIFNLPIDNWYFMLITSNKQLIIDNKHIIIDSNDSQMADISKERLKK